MIKTATLAMAAFGFLLSAPPAANAAPTQRGVQADTAQSLDQAFENLRSKVTDGTATPSDYDRVNQAIAADPALAPYRARLEAIVASLRSAKMVKPDDVKRLHALVEDSRLELAFQTLHAAIEKGRASEEDFDRVAKALVARALVAQGMELDFRAHQKRLESAVADLKAKFLAKDFKPADFEEFQMSLSKVRVDSSLSDLERRIDTKAATEPDFAYVRQVIQDYVADAMSGQGSDAVVRQVNGILDSIQKRVLAGEAVTPEQFAQLRTSLTNRAREASSGGK
jgi:hypothetical protein